MFIHNDEFMSLLSIRHLSESLLIFKPKYSRRQPQAQGSLWTRCLCSCHIGSSWVCSITSLKTWCTFQASKRCRKNRCEAIAGSGSFLLVFSVCAAVDAGWDFYHGFSPSEWRLGSCSEWLFFLLFQLGKSAILYGANADVCHRKRLQAS